jgi:hypothetical protein
MALDGRWDAVSKTPMGDMPTTFEFSTADGSLSGTVTVQGHTLPIDSGSVDGDDVTFAVQATQPMKMKLKYSLTVRGDSIDGKVKPGMMPSRNVSGTRAAAAS